MSVDSPHTRRWQEPIRIGISALWVLSLSLWTFYQGLWFYSGVSWNSHSLTVASAVLRTIRPLWLASFFPALAFGLAWYVFSHRPPGFRTTGVRCGIDRLTIGQTYATLCTSICVFTLNYRILPLLPLITSGIDRSSGHLLALSWGTAEWIPIPPVLEQQAFIGAVAATLVALQCWGVLPRLGGSRRRLLILSGLLLMAGLGTAWGGLLERVASPMRSSVFGLNLESPRDRGIVLGDPAFREDANLGLASYFVTHTDAGKDTPLSQLRVSWLPEWSGLEREQLSHRICELCQLPGVAVWTTNGLPLLLADDRPTNSEPDRVIEVPRGASRSRVYDPRRIETMIKVPIADTPSEVGSSDWLVLKIDFSVSMKIVLELVAGLRDQGVRRVDLAVIPYGFETIPDKAPRLSLADLADAVTYEPRVRHTAGGEVVVLPKFFAPGPRLGCPGVEPWERREAWLKYVLESPGSLPRRVRVQTAPDTRYGEFVGVIQGALTGGAETIVVSLHDRPE